MAHGIIGNLGLTYYYSDDGTGLSQSELEANVLYIYTYLTSATDPDPQKRIGEGAWTQWTLKAVAGLCGNLENESGFNPGGKEKGSGSGYGLIQWTPGTIHTQWCNDHGFANLEHSLDANLAHIQYEVSENDGWNKDYLASIVIPDLKTFATSTDISVYELACAYCWKREKPAVSLCGFHRGIKDDPGFSTDAYHVTPPHNNGYCKKQNYDADCKDKCKAFKYCYKAKYPDNLTKQINNNQQELKDTRGNAAEKWFNFLVNKTFVPRLETDQNGDVDLYKKPYWIDADCVDLDNEDDYSGWYAVKSLTNGGVGIDINNAKDKEAYDSGSVIPNCTGWVEGRVHEIIGRRPLRKVEDPDNPGTFLTQGFGGNAGQWWYGFQENEKAFTLDGWSISQKPSLGAILCWCDPSTLPAPYGSYTGPDSFWGHVAVVEAIDPENEDQVIFSESGYQCWKWRDHKYPYVNINMTYRNPRNCYTDYEFLGYIHLPCYSTSFITINSFTLLETLTEEVTFNLNLKTYGSQITKAYFTINGGTTREIEKTLSDGDNKITLDSLVPNTAYEVSVTVETPGRSAISAIVPFTTKQDYPDPIQDIKLFYNAEKIKFLTEMSQFSAEITPPKRWGYWKETANNDYGYLIYNIRDGRIFDAGTEFNKDSYPVQENKLVIVPGECQPALKHEDIFQVGVSSWVKDDDGNYIYALEGHKKFPVCSSSIKLMDISEMSDYLYTIIGNEINRAQAYIQTDNSEIIPLKVFKT